MQVKPLEQPKLVFWTAKDGNRIPVLVEDANEPEVNVVLVHGLAGDMDEAEGLFVRASQAFRNHKMQVTRFDFRGHGQSKFPSAEMTIAGEVLDLRTVLTELCRRSPLSIVLVCASLGALSCFDFLSENANVPIIGIALWNPVIDPRRTFVDPGTVWSKQKFSAFAASSSVDRVDIGDFEVGRKFWLELASQDFSAKIVSAFRRSTIPTLIFHGSEDAIVPVHITEELSAGLNKVELRIIQGAAHVFSGKHEFLVDQTVEWIQGSILN